MMCNVFTLCGLIVDIARLGTVVDEFGWSTISCSPHFTAVGETCSSVWRMCTRDAGVVVELPEVFYHVFLVVASTHTFNAACDQLW